MGNSVSLRIIDNLINPAYRSDPGVPKNPRIYLLTTRTLESGGDMRTSAIFEWDEPSFAGPPGWYKAECLQQNTLLKEVILPAGLTRISLENLPTGIVISCQVFVAVVSRGLL